jgi:hypothetical protein
MKMHESEIPLPPISPMQLAHSTQPVQPRKEVDFEVEIESDPELIRPGTSSSTTPSIGHGSLDADLNADADDEDSNSSCYEEACDLGPIGTEKDAKVNMDMGVDEDFGVKMNAEDKKTKEDEKEKEAMKKVGEMEMEKTVNGLEMGDNKQGAGVERMKVETEGDNAVLHDPSFTHAL